ncbi:hypothetical protein TL16_g06369 [Triparma laevis f. inornata]|uniref:Argininosuccinate lyase n=2 Tax=Triparma laevis TaxID=1534972 RepID=A0A9W7CC21_9STRA|nr:hypothetical protein TL16_g06369 [Triparma laevis f. inornata]GMI07112.1 hypothetical protein TrLO_g3429 [Triparma laevis f. longispina]
MSRGGLFGKGGRFNGSVDPVMEKFNASISFDKRMWEEDLDGSITYARALVQMGVVNAEESEELIKGLNLVKVEWSEDKFELKDSDEDIHTANERRLTELIGPLGGKLHTGRSRNDQVATDTRLYVVKMEKQIINHLLDLLSAGCKLAKETKSILCPGYTHLQPAQPIRFGHWIMSHMSPVVRDVERLIELIPRANQCPLGCGALAGNAFSVDREFLASDLGFDGVLPNSLDAVCDRDFVVEFLFWHSMFLSHLSQFSEDVIIMNLKKEVIISDAYATGSSLMPQKKNPDALELLRGKAGMALGRAVGFTATLKGLPRAYNKDLQEDKKTLFESIDTTLDCVQIAAGVIGTMKVDEEKVGAGLCMEMLATDLADYLVRKGVPFRETHHISGAVVRLAEETGTNIGSLTLAQLQAVDARFEGDVMKVWNYEQSVERKNSTGGTSLKSVEDQIAKVEAFMAKIEEKFPSGN